MTLKFNKVPEVVQVHVHAKCHQAKCTSPRVIMLTEKKNLATMLKTVMSLLLRTVKNNIVYTKL